MKKTVFMVLLCVALIAITFTGCGTEQPSYDTYTNASIIQGGSGMGNINIEIKSCKDYGSQVQIETKDGYTYLVDKSRVLFCGKTKK